ncbi:rhomboid family intramembrane serine protease [Oceanobacter mangrovi]|uniref:rhomboid family intramembrane serine protease n=1 Tax=Oceanobacter mangrovi TaxID=2862510 RepID=UPI001C8D123A|nr:rhomboid family intramembrane serine protease [Oceanobacter mangrovi]
MVILPVEKHIDWQRPPVALITLVVLNLLAFFFWQAVADNDRYTAFQRYVDSGMQQQEWPAYQSWVLQNDPDDLERVLDLYTEQEYLALASEQLGDPGFYPYLQQHPHLLGALDQQAFESWLSTREQIAKSFGNDLAGKYGLVAADPSPLNFISYQFLHGDTMHLVGNMVFLVFCGFAVEAAIGPLLFLAFYLVSGGLGGLLYVWVEGTTTTTPLIGASAAISGVMAMYLAVFRLRKIEFFYWVYIFAGYFRAPALLVLPLYVGKELLDYIGSGGESMIAYMAHAGGFVAGAGMMAALYLLRPSALNVRYIEANQAVDGQQLKRAKAFDLTAAARFPMALDVLADMREHGHLDFRLRLLVFQLQLAQSHSEAANALADLMLTEDIRDDERLKAVTLWSEHPELHTRVDVRSRIQIAEQLAGSVHHRIAELIFRQLFDPSCITPDIQQLARSLALANARSGDRNRQQKYQQIADYRREGMPS